MRIELAAIIPAASLGSAGTLSLTVFNPAPGGGYSGAQTVTVGAANLAPRLASVAPTSIVAGSAQFKIDLNGAQFVQGAVAYLDGVALQTTFISDTVLSAQVPASSVAQARAFLEQIPVGAADRERIAHSNAEHLLGL